MVLATASINSTDTITGGFVCIVLNGAICGGANNVAAATSAVVTGTCQRRITTGTHIVRIGVVNALSVFGMSVNVTPLN